MSEFRPLDGRVALITGCSRRIGIGFAIARRLASDGARLFLQAFTPYDAQMPWGADPDGAAALAAELGASGGQVEYIEADFH